MLRLGKKVLIFDGGMGSEIEKKGLSDFIPEELNITHENDIFDIHNSYTGADIITTNTFGLNRIKYHGKYELKDLALKAIEIARKTSKLVFFDIGPTGAMLEPIGTLKFDEAYEAFKEIVLIAKDYVDGFIAETFSDLYELKALILAVKENTNKPLITTMTFDKTCRTLTGSTPEIFVNTAEALGVECVGVNCSLGPVELYETVKRIVDVSHVPVIVQPNRGLPKIKNGKTTYDLEYDVFEEYTKKFIDLGVSVVGGCCGTNPEFINGISKFKDLDVKKLSNPYKTLINSGSKIVELENVKICGERLNPTGKKKLKEALLNGDYEYLVSEGIKQVDAGADLLDLNVGVPKIDEVNVMKNAIKTIQEFIDLPLQIDSSNKDAIELGARYYNGIPLINSVNGEREVMDRVFPIVKKYGCVVLGLTLDDNGVPKTAEERYLIAKRIVETAEEYGISRNRIIIDTLVLTASAEQSLVQETIKALRLVKTLGVKTALGVSNVSFGLPNRGLLNKTFLTMAMTNGLNMPIMNPLDTEMVNQIKAFNVLMNYDINATEYINLFQNAENVIENKNTDLSLYDIVKRGLKNDVKNKVIKDLESYDAMYIINEVLIKSLDEVGKLYDNGKIFLPQLISSAEAAKEAFKVISEKFPKSGKSKGKIVICTVKGDVHDIGKNIVKVILESYGYECIDLGKDTKIEAVVEAYLKHEPIAIGLSALMTTTVLSMEETIKALRKINCKAKIFVGGAVLTSDIAREIDADYYTKDALEFVNVLENIIK